jgi:D-glycero-D-manno-heptose 1,7-bisphosphate phosphatase
MNIFSKIDKSWTLFLDRDGVINEEKKEDYIRNWEEFRFYEGVREALEIFAGVFGRIVMVTNQRGVGKQLMTIDDLENIHANMAAEINEAAGRIDKIYHCSSLDNDCYERKPNPGMAHLAKKDFPEIDFSKSIIIGNKLSDMKFGRNAGIYTIYVATTNPEVPFPHPDIDLRFNTLLEVALYIRQLMKS